MFLRNRDLRTMGGGNATGANSAGTRANREEVVVVLFGGHILALLLARARDMAGTVGWFNRQRATRPA
jgi:hypothetical protein